MAGSHRGGGWASGRGGHRGRGRALPALVVAAAAALAAPSVSMAAGQDGDASSTGASEPTGEELAAARQLFQEGKDLEKKKAWVEALERFRKVADVKMTPQVRFHIALCEENLGRLVSAINNFERAAEEARRMGRGGEEVATNAPKRAAQLRKRVAAVRINVQGTVRTSKVMLDGKPVAPALFGTEIPLNPGAHKITVERGGEVTFSKEITLTERGRDAVDISIDDPEPPPDAPDPGPEPASPDGPATSPSSPDTPDASPDTPDQVPPSGSRLPAVLVGGAGIAALAGAGVFFALRESAFSDVRETCQVDGTKQCDSALEGRFNDGKTYTTVAAVLGGVGGAALVTGGILWFALAPDEPAKEKTSIRIAPTLGGLRVDGTF